jgi:squalene-associated FAD-dependent desaturase
MTGTVHIVGAGVSGLAAAVTVTNHGRRAVVYEATQQAGGRCRSFYDKSLEELIDNGNHAVFGANTHVFSYLSEINAKGELTAVNESGDLPFVDCASGKRWTVRPGRGRIPLWIFDSRRRPPDTSLTDFGSACRLLWARDDQRVGDVLEASRPIWSRFWDPLCTAALNTRPDVASAALFGAVLWKLVASGGEGLRTYVAKTSLSDTFIAPAIKTLAEHGGIIHFNAPLKDIDISGDKTTLQFRRDCLTIDSKDSVILCLPPWSKPISTVVGTGLSFTPSSILNVHFKVECMNENSRVVGLVNSTAQWVFTRPGMASVTVSASDQVLSEPSPTLIDTIWGEVMFALNIPDTATPPHRVIAERRSTPVQDPSFAANRPSENTDHPNVFLAGDWMATGLPCTLESAIMSGQKAARLAMKVQ